MKKAAGRRSSRQSRSTQVAIQSASTSASSTRIAQRPLVCSSSLTVQLSAPIHCACAASKKMARAMVRSSCVVANTVARITKRVSGTRRCDHQNRQGCMRFRTTAGFR
jgi:hypothetical protein